MSFPVIDLNGPTHVALHWGWVLVTSSNLVVFVLIAVVFVVGITVREPGVKRDLDRVRRERAAAAAAPVARDEAR